ncbi:hypothetical protein HDV00_001044 [Rhizophlyctis rosea]|nr:hypothetical protein HDV00_001044 [Rhizophlyctis rosea]
MHQPDIVPPRPVPTPLPTSDVQDQPTEQPAAAEEPAQPPRRSFGVRLEYKRTVLMSKYRNPNKTKHVYIAPPGAVIFDPSTSITAAKFYSRCIWGLVKDPDGDDPEVLEDQNVMFGLINLTTSEGFFAQQDKTPHLPRLFVEPREILCLEDSTDPERLEWVQVKDKIYDRTAYLETHEPLVGAGMREEPKSLLFVGRALGQGGYSLCIVCETFEKGAWIIGTDYNGGRGGWAENYEVLMLQNLPIEPPTQPL